MCTNAIFRSMHHARKCRLVISGPLSQRIASGLPRSATIPSNTRVTRRLAKLVSVSSAKHSRVHASTTLNTRIARPDGLLPSVRREVYMILRNEEERHVEEEAQRSGDDRGVEAVGSGVNSGRCGAGVGRVEAHHLRVEGEVWRAGRQPGATVAAATREVHLKLPSRASGQAGLLLK